jgi:hypothetical protein
MLGRCDLSVTALNNVWRLPNDWRISCRRSTYRPHKSTLPLLGRQEADARAERRPAPACRLHARVRLLRVQYQLMGDRMLSVDG